MVDVLSLGAVSTISFCYDLCRLIKGFFPTLKDAGGLFFAYNAHIIEMTRHLSDVLRTSTFVKRSFAKFPSF